RLRARRDPRAAGGRPRRPDDRPPGGDQLPRAPPGRAPADRGRTRRRRLLPGGARARPRVPLECGRPRSGRPRRRRPAAPLHVARLSPGRSRRHGPRQARLMMTSRVGTGLGGWLLPFVLSATAGAVDVIVFLALGGLFTAHITGNVVILAAHYLTGRRLQGDPEGDALAEAQEAHLTRATGVEWTPCLAQKDGRRSRHEALLLARRLLALAA